MITVEMIVAALGGLFGLSALVVALTQVFKNWWNKDDKRWLSHLLSFVSAILCNGIVLIVGIFAHTGMWAEFDYTSWLSWVMWAMTTIGCTGVANGMWSYEWMKKILEFLHLLPKETTQTINEAA
jgi:hypothetical protein